MLEESKRVHGGDEDQKQEIEKYKEMGERSNKQVWSGCCVLGSA